MHIKVEPFLIRKGIKVAKAAIEFGPEDSFLAGWHLVGFTICDDPSKGLYVQFPANTEKDAEGKRKPPFHFLRNTEEHVSKLETLILDVYEDMVALNKPKR